MSWHSGRRVRGRLVGVLVVVLAVGGLASFALPVVGVLDGGSAQFQAPASGFQRANALYHRATGQSAYYGVQVLLRADLPGRRVRVGRAVSTVGLLLERQRGFQRLADLRPPGPGGRAVRVVMAAFVSPAASVAAVGGLRRLLATPGGLRLDGWRVLVGGPDIVFDELESRTVSLAERVELFVGVVLLACFLLFGGLAALPVVVGATATLLVFGLLRLLAVVGVVVSVYSLSAVMGLAVGLGVDYSLLSLARYRQELDRGAQPSAAIWRMQRTAGRTVLLSAFVIAVALAVLVVFPVWFLVSIGVAAAATAVAAGLAARLLVPRLLPLLHDRRGIAWSLIGRSPRCPSSRRVWEETAGWVTRHPLTVGGVSILLLGVLAAPAVGLRLVPPSARLLPVSAESRRVEGILAKDFPAGDPAGVIYTIYKPSGRMRSVQALAVQQARIASGKAEVLPPRHIGAGTWELELLPHGAPDSLGNQRLLGRLQAAAATSAAAIGGITAFAVDQRTAIDARLPLALALVALISATALWWLTGSVVIAVKGVLMAALSVAAGIGVLVAVCGALEIADLVFLAGIAFALGVDYEMFLISRIREERDHGLTNQQAIAAGLARTGPVITAAAGLFCCAVAPFAASSLVFAREFGVGAAATVLIDASIVRLLLVPSAMTLLGERNWWSPRCLQRLHERIGTHDHSHQHKPDRVSQARAQADGAARLRRRHSTASSSSKPAGGC